MESVRRAGQRIVLTWKKCVQHMDNYNLYRFDNMTYEEYQKVVVETMTER